MATSLPTGCLYAWQGRSRGALWRLPIHLIIVRAGSYLDEDDVKHYADIYDRAFPGRLRAPDGSDSEHRMTSQQTAKTGWDGFLDIPPYWAETASLVAPRSYMQDRFDPECEHVLLARREVDYGVLRFRVVDTEAALPIPMGRFRKVMPRLPRRELRVPGKVLFDFRLRAPDNWAHFLNNHLPIFFVLCDRLGLAWDETLILLPGNTPDYIHAAAKIFGLEILASDKVVVGRCVQFEADPWIGIRSIRAQWVRTPRVAAAVAAATQSRAPLPRRVFLSSRDTRLLSNVTEVEQFLADYDFVTVYAEDLSAADQFRLFRDVEDIVAIHGAALAPLLYCPANSALRQLVEILPCGHMTDVYRVMAQQVGCGWIGVRGKMKPEYVKPAYDLGAGFSAFSLDSFEVDLKTLELAFAMASHPIRESPYA